jgi:hypothetical protein
MLRITRIEAESAIRFKLEGKLAGPWVDEMSLCCQPDVRNPHGKLIVVDLTHVTFIDTEGKRLLSKLHGLHAELLASAPLTRALVEEITEPGKIKSSSRRFSE